jgi:hypothetical protein
MLQQRDGSLKITERVDRPHPPSSLSSHCNRGREGEALVEVASKMISTIPFVGLLLGCGAAPVGRITQPGIEAYEVVCDASATQSLLESKRSDKVAADVLRRSGAVIVRWIAPGHGVTADHNSGRVNVETDKTGLIIRIWCG